MRLLRLVRLLLRISIRTAILRPRTVVAILVLLTGLVIAISWRQATIEHVAEPGIEPRAASIAGTHVMSVAGIGQDAESGRTILLLRQETSDRYLAIWMRQTEAFAIALHMEGSPSPRPLSPDLLNMTIAALGGKVVRVMVTDFKDDVYYARILLSIENTKEMELDSRPSDAIALALRAGAPIYADAALLDKMGVKYAGDQ